MDQAVSFDFFIRLVRKYWRALIAWTVAGFLVAAGITFFVITPQYKSSVQILVSRHSENAATQYTDQQADVQMITTYKELITNQVILNPARKALQKQYGFTRSLGSLKNEVSVSSTQNSQVFSIDVTDSDATQGAEIANQVAKSFKQQVKKIIKVNNVTIVSPASPANAPASPKKAINLLIGLVAGLLLGFVYASVRILTDRRVHDIDFLTDELGLTSLGQVNHQHHHNHVSQQVTKLQNNQMDEDADQKVRQTRRRV
ncbi:Wzz/FepE/Etk N-terminal domain-containing protein [Lactiplantibacillus sp. WILCCON 0030]|uniref:Capsular polysaccharide biosynthesis protein CpsC n=2 Tax=Lactiplantibacillus brownii TaxID=3069269 RepID=A0ABU1A9Y2_9LACO|nr:Wzz/FepE/Etk N-terminal domain-containing protein [Lactiplantibacillus brownii]MDQ7937744.1 Wzz/FepE/Etk N-terminal domain-containing protein [Lactiplantibacillus brownii]